MLGCVDGSLIRIKAAAEDENVYVCRKQYPAMNIQGICDHRKVFTYIVARWPGSTHDAFIWSNCALNTQFENGEVDGHLLGDSAYPLTQALVVDAYRKRWRSGRRTLQPQSPRHEAMYRRGVRNMENEVVSHPRLRRCHDPQTRRMPQGNRCFGCFT